MAESMDVYSKIKCCHTYRNQLVEDYLFDELTDPEKNIFEKHYFKCEDCRHELNLRIAIKESLQENPDKHFSGFIEEFHDGLPFDRAKKKKSSYKFRSKSQNYVSLVAIVALLVVASYIVLLQFPNQAHTLSESEIENLATNHGLAFKPSNFLESQLQLQHRETLTIQTQYPRPDQVYNGDIRFQWIVDKKGGPVEWNNYRLVILNAFEEKISETSIKGAYAKFDQPLAPGLYYWLLESRVESVLIGRFFVIPDNFK